MAIKFQPKEPDPKPQAAKPKAPDAVTVDSAAAAKPGRAKAKKPAKPAAGEDDKLL